MRASFSFLSAALLSIALEACGSAPPSTSAAEPGPSATTTPAEESAAATSPSGFEVHEWALVDVLASGTTELAAGPGHPAPSTMSVRKPVIYVHLADGIDELAFSLDARMATGTILEHWPAGTLEGGHVRWDTVARRAHCDTIVSAAARGRWATPPDGVTELPDLPGYDAPSAACLTVGDAESGMLFYRGTMMAPDLPYAVVRGADGAVTVTATGDATGAPGELLRISTGLSGPWPVGHVVVSRAAVPARGASVTLPVGSAAVDVVAEGTHLLDAMLALGMSRDEGDAFVRAWSQGLFGAPPGAARELGRDERSARRAPAPPPGPPQDAVIYWLPPAAVDSIATLAISPAPSSVSRAFLVRVEFPATDTASLPRPGPTYASR